MAAADFRMIDVPLLIDTSVALNLLATEVSTALIESFGVACFVSSAVYDETIYIRSEDPGYGQDTAKIRTLRNKAR